jgi:multisubunit Na+/H+ antiporter MnhB subunit
MKIKTAVALCTAILVCYLIVLLLSYSTAPTVKGAPTDEIRIALWEFRNLDVVLQAILVFAGVVGVLALLREGVKK